MSELILYQTDDGKARVKLRAELQRLAQPGGDRGAVCDDQAERQPAHQECPRRG
ncbi:hypothetical protein [Zoogloea sp.]|uniref:hypothetical protein n=1 Tax=Zoogloea sp. TaxID=49181 RepID=UPI0026182BFB|nr:hypothetical protein [uncultured Zoogloea sp.]